MIKNIFSPLKLNISREKKIFIFLFESMMDCVNKNSKLTNSKKFKNCQFLFLILQSSTIIILIDKLINFVMWWHNLFIKKTQRLQSKKRSHWSFYNIHIDIIIIFSWFFKFFFKFFYLPDLFLGFYYHYIIITIIIIIITRNITWERF